MKRGCEGEQVVANKKDAVSSNWITEIRQIDILDRNPPVRQDRIKSGKVRRDGQLRASNREAQNKEATKRAELAKLNDRGHNGQKQGR